MMRHSLAWNHDGQGRCVCGWRNFLKEVKSQDAHLSLLSVSSGSKKIYWQPRWRTRWLFIEFAGDVELREPRRGNLGAGLWKSVGGWGQAQPARSPEQGHAEALPACPVSLPSCSSASSTSASSCITQVKQDHLGRFRIRVIINSAAVNSTLWITVFSGYMPRSGTAGPYGNSIFSF